MSESARSARGRSTISKTGSSAAFPLRRNSHSHATNRYDRKSGETRKPLAIDDRT
jgi:hypothetical protein